MRNLRRTMAAVAVVGLLGGACTKAEKVSGPGGAGSGDGDAIGDVQLVAALRSFEACDDLLGYLKDQATKVVASNPYMYAGGRGDIAFASGGAVASAQRSAAAEGAAAPTASAAGGDNAIATDASGGGGVAPPEFSGTNVQEVGVDEPDIVKTDGRRLVTVIGQKMQVIDVTSDRPKVVGSLDLGVQSFDAPLLLAGDRVLIFGQPEVAYKTGVGIAVPEGRVAAPEAVDSIGIAPEFSEPKTRVTVVDIADATAPKRVADLTLDGSLVSSRLVDGVARVVLRSGGGLPIVTPQALQQGNVEPDQATKAMQGAVAETDLDDWLPSYSYTEPGQAEPTEGRAVPCDEVRRPVQFSGLDMVTVLAVDPKDPRPGPAAMVVGAGETVYASATNLYVTSNRYQAEPAPQPLPSEVAPGAPTGASAPASPPVSIVTPQVTTEVHQFDISDEVKTDYVASGSLRGHLLNQFSLSEHDGVLRVATTTEGDTSGRADRAAPSAGAIAESFVTTLRRDGEALKQIGQVGGMGKGERIYAVRFIGSLGYVVTFRQVDPLYVLDLSDPAEPVVKGELKIPGYSAYLHPVGEGLLLGIGQDATDQGQRTGTQVSLFDVSDPGSPKRLAQAGLGQGNSEAEYDHHAFLWWPKTRLAVLPFQSYSARQTTAGFEEFLPSVGAAGFRVGRDEGVKEVGRLNARDGQPIRRTIVIGDQLLALSQNTLVTADLANLAERATLSLI